MSDPKNPVPGDKVIDASALDLVDVTPEEMAKVVKLRYGVASAIANLKRLTATQIERAGLNASDVQRVLDLHDERDAIDKMTPAAGKLFEMLKETRAMRGHEIANLLGEIAAQARRRGERDPEGPEILGPLDDLFAYQYGPGKKGSATKMKTKKSTKEREPSGG